MSQLHLKDLEILPKTRTLKVDLPYPSEYHTRIVEIDQLSVRASDSIRVEYDYDRDGWKISQASIFCWDAGAKDTPSDWQVVAFIKSFGRIRECEGCDDPNLSYPSGECVNCGHKNGIYEVPQ